MTRDQWEKIKGIQWDKRGRLFWTGGTLNVGAKKAKFNRLLQRQMRKLGLRENSDGVYEWRQMAISTHDGDSRRA